MKTPAIIWIALTGADLGVCLALDGKPHPAYSYGWALVSVAIQASLLYWGGFFSRVKP